MKVISVETVKAKIIETSKTMCFSYPDDIKDKLKKAQEIEESERAKIAMKMLMDNADIAINQHIPICQDTGMVVVYLHVGFSVCFDGDINKAINEAVSIGYIDNYLRKSIVDDPVINRINTKDNTPCVIYTDYVDSDNVEIELMAKGFGSENMSAIAMLKPAQGLDGVKDFIIDTLKKAGPNACPPMVVGVGIGGTFDYAAYLSKKALLRSMDSYNDDETYAQLEKDLLCEINNLNIGPLGLKGKTTALKVNIEKYPTHIAGMPVAVNVCCHACRHGKVVVE